MKCVLLGIAAVIGFFALAESLTCNSCSLSLLKICLGSSSTTCTTNTSVCTTSTVTFPSIAAFPGFNMMNCLESSNCNASTSDSILGASYTIKQACCSTDKCNSGASYVHFSLSAVLSAALLACVWGQSVY